MCIDIDIDVEKKQNKEEKVQSDLRKEHLDSLKRTSSAIITRVLFTYSKFE
jgi:hypothetical protein